MPRPFVPRLTPPAKRLIEMIDSGHYGSRAVLAHGLGFTVPELDAVIAGRAELTETEVETLAHVTGMSVPKLYDLTIPLFAKHGEVLLRSNLWDVRDRLINIRGSSSRLVATFTLSKPIYGAPPSHLVRAYLTEIHTQGVTPTPEFLATVADILGITPKALKEVSIHDLAPIRQLKVEAAHLRSARKAVGQAQRRYDARAEKYQRILRDIPKEHRKFIGASAQIEDV